MKAAVFIDGGHLRVLVRQAGHRYDPDYIESVAHACVAGDETLLRILYYDCAPYRGNPKLPVSGKPAAGLRARRESPTEARICSAMPCARAERVSSACRP